MKSLATEAVAAGRRRLARHDGMALIIVLIATALIAVLATAIFFNVGNSRVLSTTYSKGVQSQLLVDSAVNLVIGQIRDATADGSLCWASQPGGIRTYNTNGVFANGYKLYSSPAMVISGNETSFANDDFNDLPGWKDKPGQYVDLNEPVYIYNQGAATARYPILDPALFSENVAGIRLADGTPSDLGGSAPSVKMPVQWIYILKDGTLTAGTYSGGKVVFTTNPPSSSNPIQARIAFWADDETAKVNLNTASEGLFWDTPRANTYLKATDGASDYASGNVSSVYNYSTTAGNNPATDYERGLAFIQPACGEYNRYPGHPAMNCLSVLMPDAAADISQGKPLSTDTIKKIFAFAPVLQNQDGSLRGSQMGGRRVTSSDSALGANVFPLYATVDDAAMVSSTSSAASSRSASSLFTPAQIETRRFLVTVDSRAPELNLFNRPRIAMWPVNSDTSAACRTLYDNQLALCSTIINRGNSTKSWPFFFKRSGAGASSGAYDPAKDWNINTTLYNYLTGLMSQSIPGFGGKFSTKYNVSNFSSNQLAVEMLDYIRCTNLFDSTLEGASYAANSSAATSGNEYTIGLAATNASNGTFPSANGLKLGIPGHGMALPLSTPDNSCRGMGRLPTVSEVALHVICTADSAEASSTSTLTNQTLNSIPLNRAQNQRSFQAMLHMELFNPMPGVPNMVPKIYAKITGLSNVTLGGQNIYPGDIGEASTPINSTSPLAKPATAHGAGTWFGIDGAANMGFLPLVALATAPGRGGLSADSPCAIDSVDGSTNTTSNSLMSSFFIVNNPSSSKMTVGGNITIELYYGTASSPADRKLYQTLNVDLSKMCQTASWPSLQTGGRGKFNFPPTFWSFSRNGVTGGVVENTTSYPPNKTAGRLEVLNSYCTVAPYCAPRPDLYIQTCSNNSVLPSTQSLDTIVSVSYQGGDYRLAAMKKTIDAGEWERSPLANAANTNGSDRFAHTLTMDSNYPTRASSSSDPWAPSTDGSQYTISANDGSIGGTLGVNACFIDAFDAPLLFGSLTDPSKVTYSPKAIPNVPRAVMNAYQPAKSWWGDWDNGFAAELDGPYFNFPDAGNVYQQSDTAPSYFNRPSCDVGINTVFFSPNRQVPSSGMFGSLPVGGTPWRTLLFRPKGTTPDTNHPGADTPPDHLLMDWFWMPVVSPYVISDPFSTAGKVNMNYQIQPFHHIVRQTGLYSVLKAEKIMAIPNGDGGSYKVGGSTNAYRYSIDIAKTLQQFDDKYFSQGKIFKSATEICDQYLVPAGADVASYSAMNAFWNNHLLTGDNTKERPYANIYPRLTTRSNTFRVHYRVQILQKVPGTAANVFVDPASTTVAGVKDQIAAESRGSSIVERYLEYDDPRFGVTVNPMTDTLNKAYKFRIIGVEKFNP